MKMKIKEGMPQPLDCPKCKCKNGYRITQVEQFHSDSCFDKNGIYETQIDSEYRKPIRRLKTISCAECCTKLPFEIES
jgi:hypothetical protein